MEKYFYKTEEDGITCTELCEYSHDKQTGHDLKIGSLGCIECDHCIGHDYEEEWIKCEIYSAFAEVEKLKKENSKLKKEITSLKGGL